MHAIARDVRGLKQVLDRSVAGVCMALMLYVLALPSCSTLFGHLTTAQVTADTQGVVYATRLVVGLPTPVTGPAQLAVLNQYISLVHTSALNLAGQINAGQTALPTADALKAWLEGIASQLNVQNYTFIQNMIGNLVTEYGRVYAAIAKDTPTVVAYVTAFANGTV